MRHIHSIAPLLFFCSMFSMLVGCSAQSPSQSATPEAQSDWATRWHTGMPCRLPCWETITPGKTTGSDAISYLQAQPFVSRVITTTVGPEVTELRWYWSNNELGGFAHYFSAPNIPDHTVQSMRVIFPTSVQLKDVFTTYGEPSHIIATGVDQSPSDSNQMLQNCACQYGLMLLYRDQGWRLVVAEASTTKPILEPTMMVQSIWIEGPATDTFRNASDQTMQLLRVLPWKGMQSFDAYCQNMFQEGPCVN